MQWCYAVFALVVLAGSTGAVLIDNTKPRLDVNGEIIDAHDGCVGCRSASLLCCRCCLFFITTTSANH